MEWAAAQQQQHHCFLARFTSPDPQVQASNLHQLDALAQHPDALLSVSAIVCDGSSSPTVRLSAATVVRQLLRRQTRLSFYLGSSMNGTSTETSLHQLIADLLPSSLQPDTSAFPAPLRRATTSLIATLLKAAAADSACFAAATSAWDNLLCHLLHVTAQAGLSSAPNDNAHSTASLGAGAQTAALLREMCEVALTASRSLREWVGGQQSQSAALCTLFSQQLQLLRSALSPHLNCNPEDPLHTRALAAWMENLLAAFSSCMESGVLPSTTPDFLDNVHSESGDGPAVQSLREVSAAVAGIHSDIQDIALTLVLVPFASWSEGVSTVAAIPPLPHPLQSTAPFVVAAMRYMADAVLMEPFDVLNGRFQRAAVPLLTAYCQSAASTQLVYDGVGDAASVHAAVVASVSYAAQLVHVEHFLGLPSVRTEKPGSYDTTSMTASYVACVHCMLTSAATLPPSIAGQLHEHTVQEPDSAAEMLVTSASARRRGQRGRRVDGANTDREFGDVSGGGNEGEEQEGSEEFTMADALEAQLPDNGTLRQAVAWCANSLTCNAEWMAALMPLVLAPLSPSPPAQLSDVCAMESALFVCNETVDSILADMGMTAAASGEQLAVQLSNVLQLLPPSSSDASTLARAPFLLRLQAVRFLGRLGSGLMEAWRGLREHAGDAGDRAAEFRTQRLAHYTHTALSPAGGMEGVLWTLTQVLNVEVNKAVQVECVRAITSLITDCVRTLTDVARTAGKRSTTGTSDLEEESLDDSSNSEGDDAPPNNPAHSPDMSAASMQHVTLLFQSLRLTPGVVALPQTLHLISQSLPRFQWSVRQSIYRLFSEAFPALWTFCQQKSTEPWAGGDDAAAASTQFLVRTVTAQALEVLAAHYMHLLADIRTSLFEMTSLLSCMADVATVMDAAALETVLPWILQVAHHVLSLYAEYLAGYVRNADGTSGNTTHASFEDAAVDMTDMCMVSLDLMSCVCDGLLDRDALLALQLCPQKQAEAAAMDARVMALAAVLLYPAASINSRGGSSGSSCPVDDALPNRCVALLTLCQSRPDHPLHVALAAPATAMGPQEESAGGTADELGEVRRACFAILYDCTFLLAYSGSLYRPFSTQIRRTASGDGLSDALGNDLFTLCLREVMPHGAAEAGISERRVDAEELKAVLTQNVAASDALLCLGALLSLWDQQSCAAQRKDLLHAEAHSDVPHASERVRASRPASLLSPAFDSTPPQSWQYVQHVFESLLSLLADAKFAAGSYLRLNMTTAVCGLATLLASSSFSSSSADSTLQQHRLSHHNLVALFGVVSSRRVREYAPDAASGEAEGMGEAGMILWCLGRVWQDAAQPLPHDALSALLRARGNDMAKTAAWLLRCITTHTNSLPLPMCPFWASLLELWRPAALSVAQAAQAGVLALTLTQSSVLHQLLQL
ncbi:hypothetical protein ABB37_05929 [Leptomonas pyrrhocoris]|uniref:Uncharacterized protein n=1 Tax=Leptomonas pyrrhocoris TaxID=157538 RepID=A0A0N1J4P5_LEPPY|nr:hypothetical protein ABB37_05929 [Leptomonas pyrrhocoris]KPA78852.1 hypothetical protein ABB37_05929 [Leptomonas pyrrhocoris]|eukprot:XP_015657291.1 hypothetical protein ABB37_05929 [Leptomonas pyrrhocoris]